MQPMLSELMGFQGVQAASRMNSAIVIFLDDVAKAEKVVESGVVINDTFTPVFPLANPARRIIISNVPPFIKNEDLAAELSHYGRVIFLIKMMIMGGKTRLEIKHVVCYQRQTFMVLKDGVKDLNLSLSFMVEGFSYIVFVTSETSKCFACGAEGYLAHACLERKNVQKKIIHSLRAEEGSSLTTDPEIWRYATQFYRELYSNEFMDNPELGGLFFNNLPKVDAASNTALDSELIVSELHTAVMSLANEKAPGIDGLPVEFYKSFWLVLGKVKGLAGL